VADGVLGLPVVYCGIRPVRPSGIAVMSFRQFGITIIVLLLSAWPLCRGAGALADTPSPAAAPDGGTTYHVAPTGDDAASGAADAPFRTIQRAADAAQAGDTILVRPGVYRERVAPRRGGIEGKPITYRSVERHAAIIKGSDVWAPEWHDEGGGIFSAAVDEALFTDTAHVDGANPFRVASSATPWGREGRPEHARAEAGDKRFKLTADANLVYSLGQVFVDGSILRQVPFRKELAGQPGGWWFDADAGRLFVNVPRGAGSASRPQDHEIEITTRRRIFAPHVRGLGHIAVEGFVLEHCGNQYPCDFWLKERPEWQQAGAIGPRSGHHWRFTDNVIRHANGLGIDLGAEGSPEADLERPVPGHTRDADAPRHPAGYHVVEGNRILDNGAAGTAGYGSRNLVISRNVITGNNALEFTGQKRWESAGLKLHAPHGSVIEGNLIADNLGRWGLWLDQGAGERSKVRGNVVVGHEVGIDFEIGSKASCLCANNVLIDNAVGIRFRESGGVTIAHNTIVGSTVAAIEWPYDAARSGNWSGGDVGIYNNLLAGSGKAIVTLPAADHPRYPNRRFDGNLYGFLPTAQSWGLRKELFDLAGWRETWSVANAGSGCDAASAAVGPITHSYDRSTGRLTITLPQQAVVAGVATIPGVAADLATDISGAPRAASAGPVPGAWAVLQPGDNAFQCPLPAATGVAREPVNDAEVRMQNKYLDKVSPELYAKWVAHVQSRPAAEQAWLRKLEDQLGAFYFPIYVREVVAGKVDPRADAWAYVADDPALPRVLLIGDSISRSYTAAVRKALEGRANVHRAPANCGRTDYFFKHGEIWLEQNGSSSWDVVAVNFGIHDHGKPPEEYAANLRRIIRRLRDTGATVLWVRTTPWGKPEEGDKSVKTNPTSDRIAGEEGLAVVDLHATFGGGRERLQTKDSVHFTPEGAEKLGSSVAEAISAALQRRPAKP
jgi:lysophospholipase L1-like esterase